MNVGVWGRNEDMTESLAISQHSTLPAEVEKALVAGDLSGLSAEHRVELYHHICKTQGLNPYTRPFQMMKGQDGKLWYYAGKNCADQIRNIHNVTLTIPSKEIVEGCYIVTARASLPNGRQDEDIGGVPIANLKGEALANAMMKAITKAKRRVTLSIVGLGMLDETEIESIPGVQVYHEPMGKLPEHSASAVIVEDQEKIDALLHVIDLMLQPAFRWDMPEERQKGMALIREIFGVGYKALKSLSVEELQAGYDELQSVLACGGSVSQDSPLAETQEGPEAPVAPEPSIEAIGQPAPQEPVREPHPVQELTELYATKAQIKRVQTYAERKGLGAMVVEEMRQHPDGIPLQRLNEIETIVHKAVEAQAAQES
jgi:hypothetical protein